MESIGQQYLLLGRKLKGLNMGAKEGTILISETMRPISVNDAYKNVPGKDRIKTGEYKRFKTDLEERLPKYKGMKDKFFKLIEGQQFILETVLKIYVPTERMYTKKGDINRNKGDCGNYRKCTQDIVFDWLGIDDKYSLNEKNLQIEDDQGVWGFSFEIIARDRKGYLLA